MAEDPKLVRCPKRSGWSRAGRQRSWSFVAGCLVSLLTMCWAVPVSAAEAPAARPLANLFEPERVTQIALSPDGEHLAYTVHEGRTLSLVVMNLAQPEAKTVLPIGEDQTMDVFHPWVTDRASVSFLQWSDAGLLVYGL